MRLTPRAFLLGCALSVFLIVLDVGIVTRVQKFGLCVDTIGAGAVFSLFLLESRTAFSFWFFPLFFVVQNGWMASRGLVLDGPNEPFAGPTAFSSFEGMGGMICLVIVLAWTGRESLARVFRKAFVGDPRVDDSGEPASYRTAVWGLILSVLGLLGWLVVSGVPLGLGQLGKRKSPGDLSPHRPLLKSLR